MISKFNRILFTFSVLFTLIYYIWIKSSLGPIFSILSQICVLYLLTYSIITCIRKKFNINLPLILKIWLLMLFLAFLIYALVPNYAVSEYLLDIREFLIPFAICFSSYITLSLSEGKIEDFFIPISVLGGISAIIIIFNSGGFVIQEIYRIEVMKNQTGPMYVQLGLLNLYFLINSKKGKKYKILYLIVFICCLIFPVILRARTCLLTLVLLSLYIIFRKYKMKSCIIIPFIIIALLILEGDYIIDVLSRSFLGSSDITDVETLTSGRASRADKAFDFISKYPLVGGLNDIYYIFSPAYRIPHQFILWKLVKYGFLGALPFLTVYISLIFYSIRLLKHNSLIDDLSFLCLSSAIMISFAEYSAPFGPATSFIICYIVMGYSLKYNNIVTRKYLKSPKCNI